MARFQEHPALRYLQTTYFKHSPDMYPADYGVHFKCLPVPLAYGHTHVVVDQYRSTYTAERKNECLAFLRAARDFCGRSGSRYSDAHDWMRQHQKRVVQCFVGQGLPEEISLVCSLAVASGFKSVGELGTWASTNFGQDCVGFVSSYLIALGTLEQMILYIPKYKQMAGVATAIDDIKYDNAILWADYEDGVAKVRPNPGNKSHIAIIECWENYGSTFYVAQAASSKGGVDYDRVYEIVQAPKSQDKQKAYWKIRQKGGWRANDVVITKTVPSYSAGD